MDNLNTNITPEDKKLSIKDFLVSIPPGKESKISFIAPSYAQKFPITLDDISLHCENDSCDDFLFFKAEGGNIYIEIGNNPQHHFIVYRCKNCEKP